MARTSKTLRQRVATGIGTCAVATVLSIAVGASTRFPNVVPGATTGAAGRHAADRQSVREGLNAPAAIALTVDQSEETPSKAERWANDALLDDPLEETAVRTLSFVNAYRSQRRTGDHPLLRYGEALSKRDLMTEIALALELRSNGQN